MTIDHLLSGTGLDVAALVAKKRDYFYSAITADLSWRQQQLVQLRKLLLENEQRLFQALHQDLNKPHQESYATEVFMLLRDIDHALKHLPEWVVPQQVATPTFAQPSKSYVLPEPLGAILIIAHWSCPLLLSLGPLVPAIAAGNCAVIKPSELAAATSALLAELLPHYLDSNAISCIEGAAAETTALLEQRWDHIFYTGGGAIGRVVMTAAAKHLTPVTLELGGKNPCIVTEDADMIAAARRIAWGKFTNAGQTCIAPDYLLCTESSADKLVPQIEAVIGGMFGDNPLHSKDYGRIINRRHTRRLAGYLGDGDIVCGGTYDIEARYVAPTLLRNVRPDTAVMQEEIFGPLLPVMVVDSLEQAQAFVNSREKPLALYVFTRDQATARALLRRCSSGNACINDCMMFMTASELPFGGVGQSGMGAYHGKHGFKTFSHFRAVMENEGPLDMNLRYPPFNDQKLKLLRRLR